MSDIQQPPETMRFGRFSIARDVLLKDWKSVQPFFAKCVVVEAQYDEETGCHVYLALSDEFQPAPISEPPPWYAATVFPLVRNGKVVGVERCDFLPESVIKLPEIAKPSQDQVNRVSRFFG